MTEKPRRDRIPSLRPQRSGEPEPGRRLARSIPAFAGMTITGLLPAASSPSESFSTSCQRPEPQIRSSISRHCEEPAGPRFARPEDKLRDEAISGNPKTIECENASPRNAREGGRPGVAMTPRIYVTDFAVGTSVWGGSRAPSLQGLPGSNARPISSSRSPGSILVLLCQIRRSLARTGVPRSATNRNCCPHISGTASRSYRHNR